MTVDKLYSLPVERIDGKKRGYVLAVLREGARVCALACADENEREFFVDCRDAVRVADCVIYEKEGAKRSRKSALRLNVPCYDERGRYLGAVQDFTLRKFDIKSCSVNGKSYPFERLRLGDVALLADKNSMPAAIAAKDMFLQAVVGASGASFG